ncbi:Trimethyllysine dioxygenase [Sphaceloma murrayae]|uniref:trimethyllysine dioxygenase n=1 Tax=Sphaceloma murrayae TaxID=2082308 RepID=A0A2K1QWJ3_9PEZI|nr:Trimethyllysine dioxygenase [Sphaceloma murrayae]
MLPTKLLRAPHIRNQLRQGSQKRSIQASVRKEHAVTREHPAFSDLYQPSPPPPSAKRTTPAVNLRDLRTDPAFTFTPFEKRAANIGPLRQDNEHTLSWDGSNLILSKSGSDHNTAVSHWWLRDHCPCSICMNQVTKQRQVNHLKGLANAPRIRNATVDSGARVTEVEWNDGHRSVYESDFIIRKQSSTVEAIRRGNTPLKLWGSDIERDPPSVDYSELQAGRYGELMEKIRVNGFCFIPGTPNTPEASEAILKEIGPIRETHFGGFHVVTSDLMSKALEPHTDTTYFSDGAGLQMLHLLSHEHGRGGESLFIDGFNCARQLYQEAPELYQVLATYGIYAHATGNEGVNMQPCDSIPVLRHDHSNTELLQVRWNNADRAGVAAPMDKMDMWYDAASKYQELLDRKENQYWFQLKPGTPMLFDNWRLLHGRSEFTGLRRVCGAYINHDDYVSKYKTTNYSDADLMAATVSG